MRAVVRPGGRRRGATVLLDGVRWTVRPGCGGPPATDVHWSVDPDGRAGARWAGSADVLRCGQPSPGTGAASLRAMKLLARHTGCLLTAVPADGGGLVIGVRGGRLLTVEYGPLPHGPYAGAGEAEVAVLASYVHGRLVAGLPLDPLSGLVAESAGRVLHLREVHPGA
ncbi:hypothetical protein GCM10010324_08290 [Streptomyces hiroshimensis]|uniref:Uncharacterized protein n=1 Tax=Streptomyces hiroshimensis TaxID=66424 RepID=A0ABQ2Y715_9ACTN|nr:hypothetical protein GCM10010324_08290 [Streptomyces hiroshimensis]